MMPIIHDHTVPSVAQLRVQQAYMVKMAAEQSQQSTITHPTTFTLTHGQSPKRVLPKYMHTNPRYMRAVRLLNRVKADTHFRPQVQYKLPEWNDSYLTVGSIRPDGSIVGVQPKPVKAQPVVQPSVPAVSPPPQRPIAPAPVHTPAVQPKYNVYQKNILQYWNNIPAYFDALLDGIKHAEMFDWIQQGKDLFIRTAARPDKENDPDWRSKSSTAFGPYQITYKLAKDMFARYPTLMAKHLKFYNSVLKPQYELFLKHGNQQGTPGYDPRYDYGGAGKGLNQQQRKQYMQFARDVARIRFAQMMRKHKYTTDKDAMHGFIQVWHSNPDAQYKRRVINRLHSAYPGVYR